jgi:FMN-dependent NADH-azoreductase
MKLLHIDSSPLAGASVSRELTRRVVAEWRASHPRTTVEHLDLAKDAPNHLNMDSLGFRMGVNADGLTEVQRRENEVSERLVSQFLAADVIVASTRGGKYFGNPAMEAMEHQESYLKTMFGFLGITDVRFVRAEGVAMGAEAKEQAMEAANVAIRAAVSEAANEAEAALAA